jgi:hypothetical protein
LTFRNRNGTLTNNSGVKDAKNQAANQRNHN